MKHINIVCQKNKNAGARANLNFKHAQMTLNRMAISPDTLRRFLQL